MADIRGSSPDLDILRFSSDQEPEEEIWEPLFYLDDNEYNVWVNPPTHVGLTYMDMTRKLGRDVAVSYLLETMLGEESYKALIGFERLTAPQFESVLNSVVKVSLGARGFPKAKTNPNPNGPKGRKRPVG